MRAGQPNQHVTAKPRRYCPCAEKILNVASATADKLSQNQELSDLALALGVKGGKDFSCPVCVMARSSS